MKSFRPWAYSISFAGRRTGAIDRAYQSLGEAIGLITMAIRAAISAVGLAAVYVPFYMARGLAYAAFGVPLWMWRAAQYRRVGWRRLVMAVSALMPCPACGAAQGSLCVGAELHMARHPNAQELRAKLIAMFGPLYGEGWR